MGDIYGSGVKVGKNNVGVAVGENVVIDSIVMVGVIVDCG